MSGNKMTRPCPSCGGVMRRGVQDEVVKFKDESLTYEQPGWHCGSCGDGILEASDNEYHDAALHEIIARAKRSPISPLLVRAAREAVGFSQREAGKVFGGGPTAFYKYETAKVVPSVGMATLLRLALRRPDLFQASGKKVPAPSIADIDLLRSVKRSDRLDALIHRIYPEKAA